MSTAARSLAPRVGRSAAPRARLTVVQGAPMRRSATGFSLICGALLALGLIALLLLNTARAEQSFALSSLQNSQTTLADNEEQLRGELSSVSAPQQVALAAQAQGMVQAGEVTYVRASDRKVLGVAGRSAAADPFTVGTLPDTPASAVADKAVAASSGAVLIQAPESKPTTDEKATGNTTESSAGTSGKDDEKKKDDKPADDRSKAKSQHKKSQQQSSPKSKAASSENSAPASADKKSEQPSGARDSEASAN